MSHHSTRPEMEQFCARALESAKMAAIGEHMADCPECRQLFHSAFQARRNHIPVVIDLSPEKWLKREHLDYEWLVSYVDETMESDEQEITQLHLRLCRQCREDVQDFMAGRETVPEPLFSFSHDRRVTTSEESLSWWEWLKIRRRPAMAFVTILVIGAAVTLTAFLLKTRQGERHQVTTSPTPTISASDTPVLSDNSPPALPATPVPQLKVSSENESARAAAAMTKPAIHLSDSGHVVTLDESGKLTGLSGLSTELEKSVRNFLLSGKIGRPVLLADLAGIRSDLRGEGVQPSFRLLFPAGIVIADDQPVFKWDKLSDAESYRVYVSDSRSRKVADSGILSPNETAWSPPLPLRRGEIYSWSVGAVVNGEEILSPSITEPEAKFKVLSVEQKRKMDLLKRRTTSHLALGIFYARNGMLAEAEDEFQKLTEQNPDSPVALRLLKIIRSWR